MLQRRVRTICARRGPQAIARGDEKNERDRSKSLAENDIERICARTGGPGKAYRGVFRKLSRADRGPMPAKRPSNQEYPSRTTVAVTASRTPLAAPANRW